MLAGQAQKEFFVNEALTRVDSLLHPTVLGEAQAAPADPTDGDCWIVGDNPEGEWAGQAQNLACRQAGTWLFVAPSQGMRAFDAAAGQFAIFDGAWHRAGPVTGPSGGDTADLEARAAIAELIAALAAARIIV
jgi:hypothetical protein